MKKVLVFFSLILVGATAMAQTEKNVGDFTKVTAFDRIEVQLVLADENKVLVDDDNVELINKNGELKIRMPLDLSLQGDNVLVTVYCKHLTAAEANEGSQIRTNDAFEANHFEIIAKEGSEINLHVEAKKINVKAHSGSTIHLTGEADYQQISVTAGATVEAEKCITQQTEVSVNAGGEATVYATDYVKANVRAGGEIYIYGNPKQVDKKTLISGTIEVR